MTIRSHAFENSGLTGIDPVWDGGMLHTIAWTVNNETFACNPVSSSIQNVGPRVIAERLSGKITGYVNYDWTGVVINFDHDGTAGGGNA